MSETADAEGSTRRGMARPLMAGLVLAALAAAGGYAAVARGLVPGLSLSAGGGPEEVAGADVAFVPVDPLVISIPAENRTRHLRFRAQLEVRPGDERAVTALLPRVVDVLNGYLRAVDPAALDAPGALVRLRAQMLRRVKMVVGDELVRDLLVMEFVLD